MSSPLKAGHDQRAQAALLLAQAMQRDVEKQGELIAARAWGHTDAAYWCDHHGTDQRRWFVEETQRFILRTSLATKSIREQIARSRTLLDLCQPGRPKVSATL